MLHPRPIRRRQGVGRLAGLLTLGLLLAVGIGVWAVVGRQPAEEPAFEEQLSVNLESEITKPVRIYGRDIMDWHEGGERVILMRDKVWVQQDLVRLCLQEGIAWITAEDRNGSTIYHVDIYGEKADLEQGNGRKKAERVRVKMTTTGFLFKSFAGNIQHASASNDPLFARAAAMRGPGWAQAAAQPTLAAAAQETQAPAAPAKWMAGSGQPAAAGSQQSIIAPPVPATITDSYLMPASYEQPPLPPPAAPAPPSAAPALPPLGAGQIQPPAAAPGVQPALPISPLGTPVPMPPPQGEAPSTPVVVVPMPGPPPVPGQMPLATAPIPIKNDTKPAPMRIVSIRSRSGTPGNATKAVNPNGESVYMIPSGVIITVKDALTNKVVIDIEADRVVFWNKDGGQGGQDPLNRLQTPDGDKTNTMEFYLSGHVQIRNQQSTKETQTLRADEVYYDVSRNVAVALKAEVEIISPQTPFPLHIKAEQLTQIGPKKMEMTKAQVSATPFPSDPGIHVDFTDAVYEQLDTPKTNIFGLQYTLMKTGQPDPTPQKVISGTNAVTWVEGVPIMYFPKFKTDPERPLGPLEGIGVNYSTIFGFQFLTTWNMFDLLGIVPDSGKKWQLYADYMSARGPGLGSTYRDEGKNLLGDLFGLTNKYEINVKLYGMSDSGIDQIGGSRGTSAPINPWDGIDQVPVNHPDLRGRALGQIYVRDLPNDFTFLGQLSAISDQNYLDQFNNTEWLNGLNQDTYAYLKQQRDFWYWSVLVEDRIRPWITETNWLPKVDGYVAGVDLFDAITWNSKVGAGYGQLVTSGAPPGAYLNSDQNINTARVDWWQDFSLPFNVGDARLVPYVVTDVTYYSQDIAGEQVGRIYGGFGLRGSIPLSKLYPDIQSDLLNLDGIFHKITLSGNYYDAFTNIHSWQLPQLDRLNDDASDQALRNIFPLQSSLNPSNAVNLTTARLFDPQFYALQRLLDTHVDTLDEIDVLQINLNQRWQTKRGVAGDEHVVDWMTLDLGMAIFPQSGRDNYNQPIGFLSYDWLWNIGDRTALFSDGWMDPISGGPRFFTAGVAYTRPDKTNFTLSYRQIDPLDSKAVIASITYPLSAKYAITGSTMYDFGVNTQVNTVMLTRIGTDLRFSIGFSYNSILNNFSAVVEVVPNLFPSAGRGGLGAQGGGIGQTR